MSPGIEVPDVYIDSKYTQEVGKNDISGKYESNNNLNHNPVDSLYSPKNKEIRSSK